MHAWFSGRRASTWCMLWHVCVCYGMCECVVGSCLVGEHGHVSEHVVLDLVVKPPVQEVIDVAA